MSASEVTEGVEVLEGAKEGRKPRRRTLRIVAHGTPASQGSKNSFGRGQMVESDKGLPAWRATVIAASKRAAGPNWEPIDRAVKVSGVIEIRKPNSTKFKDYPAGPKDLDKLQRAIGDSLEAGKILTNDARICHWDIQKVWTTGTPGIDITITEMKGGKHSDTIDAARAASESLLATGLTPEQQKLVVDVMNATQDLNTLYWDTRKELEFKPIVKEYAEDLYNRTEAAIAECLRGVVPAASISQVLGERRAPSGYDYTAHDKRIEEVLTAAGFGHVADALEKAATDAQAEGLTTAAEVIYDLRARAAELRKA